MNANATFTDSFNVIADSDTLNQIENLLNQPCKPGTLTVNDLTVRFADVPKLRYVRKNNSISATMNLVEDNFEDIMADIAAMDPNMEGEYSTILLQPLYNEETGNWYYSKENFEVRYGELDHIGSENVDKE